MSRVRRCAARCESIPHAETVLAGRLVNSLTMHELYNALQTLGINPIDIGKHAMSSPPLNSQPEPTCDNLPQDETETAIAAVVEPDAIETELAGYPVA